MSNPDPEVPDGPEKAHSEPGEAISPPKRTNPLLTAGVPPGCERGPDGRIRKIGSETNVPELTLEGFDRLAAMRTVLAGQAKTVAEKALLASMKRNPDKFFDQYDRLETAETEAKIAAAAAANGRDSADEPPTDESNERLRREIALLWERWYAKRGTWPPPPSSQPKPG